MELTDLIQDTRLTPGACRLVLYVWSKGEGRHEIPHSEFAALLNHPGEKKLRSELSLAQDFGYLERTPGGRGHSDRYRLSPALRVRLTEDSPARGADLKNSPVQSAGLNGDSPALSGTLRGDSRGVARERKRDSRPTADSARDPESDSEAAEISSKAERAIEQHADRLAGCRDSLRDYLAHRVPDPTRQYAFVQRVVSWIDGMGDPAVWQRKNGRPVDHDARTAILADALNDLLASDERKMSRDPGDPSNLRTKIRIVVARRDDTPFGGSHEQSSVEDDGFIPEALAG